LSSREELGIDSTPGKEKRKRQPWVKLKILKIQDLGRTDGMQNLEKGAFGKEPQGDF
jgi:hypothetical protein